MTSLRKLKKLTPDELRVRGAQSLHAWLESHGWSSLTKLPSDRELSKLLNIAFKSEDDLLSHFRSRHRPTFFPGLQDQKSTVATLRRAFPTAVNKTRDSAERILKGKFDLLGLRDLNFGKAIDWQLEPVSGKRSSLEHWSRLNYLDPDLTGDKKIVWELNRHQHFITLGRAYWLTGDERYAETFAAHLQSWMERNPPKLGINWASSLEVAFRAISWVWAFEFFKESKQLTPSLFARLLKFLFVHARHVETYLSTYFSPNTHLTGEALGLFYLGTLLPEFHAAKRWQTTGRRILLEQLPKHVQGDGVYFEQSSYYHRYTTDFYLHFVILSELNGLPVPGFVRDTLVSLLDHLMCIMRPDGTTPLFGDDDGGRLLFPQTARADDFRATLGTGAALFNRNDYKYAADEQTDEVLWLLGVEAFDRLTRLPASEPAFQSRAFSDGGYYVMRDGWQQDANYLLLDCGPHGMNNCGHAHADALSIEVAAAGRTLLVDPGTYTYTGSAQLRDWFRSSEAHNTLIVDGESSSVPDGPFSWKSIANCRVNTWISRNRMDYFEGTHDGYQHLREPVEHSRSVLFLKQDYWIMRDVLRSNGGHQYDLWFHLDAGEDAELTGEGGVDIGDIAGSALKIASFAGNFSWRREESTVSHCYAERVPAPAVVFSGEKSGAHEVLTFLLPQARGANRQVREVEAIGGRAFEIRASNGFDVLLLRSDSRAEMARLASDFEWTWVRYADEGATVPEQLVLIGGQWLELNGKEVLKSRRSITYLIASRDGDQFRIETDDGVLRMELPVLDFDSAVKGQREKG